MKDEKRLTDQEKWNHVIQCSDAYDGRFYYGVTTTGVFCYPSCKAKTPNRKNVLFFDTTDEAVNQGFRPCKLCNPIGSDYKSQNQSMQEIEDFIKKYFRDEHVLEDAGMNFQYGMKRMTRLFKTKHHMTPKEYLMQCRLDYALTRLESTDDTILDIALDSGFQNLSSFYAYFRKRMKCAPGTYRKKGKCHGVA